MDSFVRKMLKDKEITLPVAVIEMAEEAAKDLDVSVEAWFSAVVKLFERGQREEDKIKSVIMKSAMELDLFLRLTKMIRSTMSEEEWESHLDQHEREMENNSEDYLDDIRNMFE